MKTTCRTLQLNKSCLPKSMRRMASRHAHALPRIVGLHSCVVMRLCNITYANSFYALVVGVLLCKKIRCSESHFLNVSLDLRFCPIFQNYSIAIEIDAKLSRKTFAQSCPETLC